MAHQVKNRDAPAGVIEHFSATLQQNCGEHVQRMGVPGKQDEKYEDGDAGVSGMGAQQDPPQFHTVGNDAGEQRQDGSGQVQEESYQTHLQFGPGQVPDEIAQNQQFHATGQFVHCAGNPNQDEVPALQNGQRRHFSQHTEWARRSGSGISPRARLRNVGE